MEPDIKRTFDEVKLTVKRQGEMKSELCSYLLETQKENYFMKKRPYFFRKHHILVMVTVILLALSLVGFAYGNYIIKLLGGGKLEYGRGENGSTSLSMDVGFVSDPIRIENNQIYFILDGSDTNITAQCSETSYYQYEMTDETGHRNVVIIGGTVDNVGMAEFVWDENGEFLGSNGSYPTEEEPQWLKLAAAKLQND